jgi:hypothetical protein
VKKGKNHKKSQMNANKRVPRLPGGLKRSAAVRGNVTIATTGVTGTTIPAAGISGSDMLYVVGDITFGMGAIAVTIAKVTATENLIAGTWNTAITLPVAAYNCGGMTGSVASTITTGAMGVTVKGTASNGKFATGAVIDGTPTFTDTTSFAGTLTNTATAKYTFNSA